MNMQHQQPTSERKGERGTILAMAALGMLALLLAVGLGVDVSRFYLAKTELDDEARDNSSSSHRDDNDQHERAKHNQCSGNPAELPAR